MNPFKAGDLVKVMERSGSVSTSFALLGSIHKIKSVSLFVDTICVLDDGTDIHYTRLELINPEELTKLERALYGI